MNGPLPYDPGRTPSEAPPRPGEAIDLELEGWPPAKDEHFSIRNVEHPEHDRFVALRAAAVRAMNGRAWSPGPVHLAVDVRAPRLESGRSLSHYSGGIADSLDGSHGETFTYLPIAYEDDCQIVTMHSRFIKASTVSYHVRVEYIPTNELAADEDEPNQRLERAGTQPPSDYRASPPAAQPRRWADEHRDIAVDS